MLVAAARRLVNHENCARMVGWAFMSGRKILLRRRLHAAANAARVRFFWAIFVADHISRCGYAAVVAEFIHFAPIYIFCQRLALSSASSMSMK